MATPILNITEGASGEDTPYDTFNSMGRALEAAANDWLEVDLSSGNVTLTDAQYRGYVLFRAANNTVARDLTLQAIKRLVVIDNSDGTATLSIIVGSTTLTLAAGEKGLYYTDGTANGLVLVGGIDIPSFDTETTVDGAADYLILYDASAGQHVKVLAENLPSGASSGGGEDKNPVAIISDTKAASTDGGTATSGSWEVRDLNTEDSDPDGIVSISSNQFTLQAGTYSIEAIAAAYKVDLHAIRLYNVTDANVQLTGTSHYANAANLVNNYATLSGVFTIGSAKTFQLEHRVGATQSSNGYGNKNSWQSNKYVVIRIVKLNTYDHSYSIGRLTIDFASDANYTLSTTAGSEEWKDRFLTFTDTGVVLTAGRDVIFPDEEGPEYIVKNSTAQTLTCKRSGQTGVAVSSGSTVRIYHDGTDMVSGP